MRATTLAGLPRLGESIGRFEMRVHGATAFVSSMQFLARVSLDPPKMEWLIERPKPVFPRLGDSIPRRIWINGASLWIDNSAQCVAEVASSECGGMLLSVRRADTGKQIWEHLIVRPDAADWAENPPAWPDAPTEENYGFLADDSKQLTVCLFRQSRRSGIADPNRGIRVFSMPPYVCQLDATCFDPLNGAARWHAAFPNVRVGILERDAFDGVWSNETQLGILDFTTGANRVLFESANTLGWPVRDGDAICVSWHSKQQVGVDWFDERGNRLRGGAWDQPKSKFTRLFATSAGLALQTNDQGLSWLGNETTLRWTIRAKPYIYKVQSARDTDVFVGTDGMGGRLLGFDASSGRETVNLKPKLGGVGKLSKVRGHDVLVSPFCVSRSYTVPVRCLVFSMKDHIHQLDHDCRDLLGTWEHGAVLLAGADGERLTILNVRP